MKIVATVEQKITIAQLRAGSEVEGIFACTRKDRLTARSGSPYLAVELRDRSGAIQARAFRDADFLAGLVTRGLRAERVALTSPGLPRPITPAELREAGVLPVPSAARRPASVLDAQEEGPEGQLALL